MADTFRKLLVHQDIPICLALFAKDRDAVVGVSLSPKRGGTGHRRKRRPKGGAHSGRLHDLPVGNHRHSDQYPIRPARMNGPVIKGEARR